MKLVKDELITLIEETNEMAGAALSMSRNVVLTANAAFKKVKKLTTQAERARH